MGTILCYGSRGRDVELLQELLNKRLQHTPKLRLDGHFGSRTASAVRLFQASVGIGIDGVAGPLTWAALHEELGRKHIDVISIPANFPDAPWMDFARKEIDQSEFPGMQHNPRILQYHASTTLRACSDETPWCSAFVNWCLRQAGLNGTNSAAAQSWITWGKASTAISGAITVVRDVTDCGRLSASGFHVGFLVHDTGSHYRLLGGNQKNRVRISKYPKSSWQVVAHRWPNS